jgi:single-strand DNA-binding protein
MGNNIAKYVISGNLIKDSELRYTTAGTPVCEFVVASNWSKKQGDAWVDQVSFFSFALFGKRAESLHGYLKKGQGVNVAGDIRQDKWEKDGQKQNKIIFAVSDIQLIGGRSVSHITRQQQRGLDNAKNGYNGNQEEELQFEDDIPF